MTRTDRRIARAWRRWQRADDRFLAVVFDRADGHVWAESRPEPCSRVYRLFRTLRRAGFDVDFRMVEKGRTA